MKNILITGHEGFIGKNLYKKLNTVTRVRENIVHGVEKSFNYDPSKGLEDLVKKSDVIFHIGAISDTSLQDAHDRDWETVFSFL